MRNFNQPQYLSGQGDIRIIGHRASGKTTYLAALAYWPNHNVDQSPIQSIEPFDRDTEELRKTAQEILQEGGHVEPTENKDDPDYMPLYTFLIDLKPKFNLLNLNQNNLRIQLSCREYGGELFEDLTKPSSSKLKFYLDDCASASGLMILLDGQRRSEDFKYAQAFDILIKELAMRLANNNLPTSNQRIAVVLTKGEQGTVWNSRKDISEFLKRKFPKTNNQILNWSTQWSCQIEYFVCSAFGVIPEVNKPNVQGGTICTIAEPQFWRPFGLVAPLYWLYTGKHDPRLNDVP